MPATPPAPLLGRDDACARLCAILTHDGVALITGEAGIGKTSLALAAVRAAGRGLVHGGGFATLAGISYLPLQVALGRPVAGDEVAVARQVEAGVRDAVLLVDDLQWTDPATRAVLALLAGRVAMLMTARPDCPELASLEAMGAETIRLGPLADQDAALVVRRTSPDMGDADVRRVLARAGGNPLILEEIARNGRVSTTIARAITAQLELASPAARRSLRALAIADHPMALDTFAPVLDELEHLGMVVVVQGSVAIRHGLIADVLTGGLSAPERAGLHAAVAALVEDPADRALHLARAGRRTDALAVAQQALDDTWDMRRRLVLLRLVADLAPEGETLSRRLAAARLAVELDQPSVVVELLEPPVVGDPGLLAIRDGLLARGFAALGQHQAAAEALDRGLASRSHDPTGEAAHLLAVELAVNLANGGDLAGALATLDQADADGAAGDPAFRHRRAGLRSFLRFLEGEAPDVDGMVAALDDALRDRNASAAVGTSSNIHSMILAHDGPGPAHAFGLEAARRLEAAGIDAWRLRTEMVQTQAFLGASIAAIVDADELLELPLPTDTRAWALVLRAEALGQMGRFGEAADSLVAAEPLLGEGWGYRGEALTTEAATALWSGRPRDALAATDKALAVPTHYAANHMFPALTRAWAAVELGQPPDPLPAAGSTWLVDAARAEWAALRARIAGEPSCDLFLQAADLWGGRLEFRAALCRWAGADGARLAGGATAAGLLRDALDAAERMGFEPVAHRARRSLRLVGVRVPRAAPPVPGTSLLTAREHEILGLVGDGLANIEIARQMGLGRPTVARIVSNAMAKLGAETRAQAVALMQARAG